MSQFSCRERTCPECGGWLEGYEDGDEWACDTCDYVTGGSHKKKSATKKVDCPACNGKGAVRINGSTGAVRPVKMTQTCHECNGTGKITSVENKTALVCA
jgi:DnaJ-class molecular chaperone